MAALHKHRNAASRVSFAPQQCGHFHVVGSPDERAMKTPAGWVQIHLLCSCTPILEGRGLTSAVQSGSAQSYLRYSLMHWLPLTMGTTALEQTHEGSLLSHEGSLLSHGVP